MKRAIAQILTFFAALSLAGMAMFHGNCGLAGITVAILYVGLVLADVADTE